MLDVSRSGYYKWLQRRDLPSKHEKLLQKILVIFEESGERYGSPRVYEQLRAEGYRCNRKVVEKLMHDNEIRARRRRKHKSTTDSKHNLPIAPNVLGQDFKVEELDEAWVSDITYISTGQGWLYLCVFIDLYSRMVVGWSMSATMTADLVVDAFNMGVGRQGRAPIVAHSDRGSQYASQQFRDLLERYDCIQSMSRKGNCWDNAVSESFFGQLKTEEIYLIHYATRIAATTAVFQYIEIFYNKRRLHSALGYLTPEEKGQKGRKVA